jgi:Fe2+ or Zn2+ uptake regulation protein
MRAVSELVQWIVWAIYSGLWTLYHTLHSRKRGPLIIAPETGNFICRRCGKVFTFEVLWETK